MLQLSAGELRRLREMPKEMPSEWIEDVIASMRPNGPHLQVVRPILALNTGPTRGTLFLYARQQTTNPRNFSAGVHLSPLGNDGNITLIRCNGAHGHTHTVDIGGCYWTFAEQPHIHYGTAIGLREAADALPVKVGHDSFAVVTGEYSDLRGALRSLSRRAHLESQGRLVDVSSPALS